MKNLSKIITSIGILILVLSSFFVIFPVLLVGNPEPLFYVRNDDVHSHELNIEVSYSHGKQVFNETYEVKPETSFSEQKPIWLLIQLFSPFGYEKECTIKATSDGNLTEEISLGVQLWNTIDIKLKNGSSGYDIFMGVETV